MDTLNSLARRAKDDILRNFWTEDGQGGHFTQVCDLVLWELCMALLALESYYDATQDKSILDVWQQEWDWLKKLFGDVHLMTEPDGACNPASDDAAWSAMCFMSIYRMTGDGQALALVAETVRRAYDCWMDGALANGTWYRYGPGKDPAPYVWCKSIYCAGLMLSALEYHEATGGADPKLYDDTLELYGWVEKYLRRDGRKVIDGAVYDADDQFYYCDYVDNKQLGFAHPGLRFVKAPGDASSLFGNTAMAAINAKLYRATDDNVYLGRARRTVNAFPGSIYDVGGVLLNDRDAWTDAAFMRYFVKDALTLPGVNPAAIGLVKNTGRHVATHCRSSEGLYHSDWEGGTRWRENSGHTNPGQLKTSATSAHMVMAAALAEHIGL